MKAVSILGAGIAGLAYANAYGKENAKIYEKQNYSGGLCHSFKIGEFSFDSAVHLSFTQEPVVREWFDKTAFYKHLPISFNYYNGLWMKHPIVNNLNALKTEEKVELIYGFLHRPQDKKIENYHDWLVASYGQGFADEFYDVYTKKYWTVKSELLTTEWIGDRLANTDIKKMLFGAFEQDTSIDYYAKEMRYPKEGGYETFLSLMKQGIDIEYNKNVTCVNLKDKTIKFADGTCEKYEQLASSLPLNYLVSITEDAPKAIKKEADKLHSSKISIISVGFSNPDAAKWLWFYIYDQDIFAARVNSPSLKSKNNAPLGCSSLQFEIYHYPTETIIEEEIIKNVKSSILKMKLCKPGEILFMDYRLLEQGNVIYEQGMCDSRDNIRQFFQMNDVDLIGRFGEFEYYWSDQAFMSGWDKGRQRKERQNKLL